MADSSVDVTPGTGASMDTRTESTNSNHRQVVVIGDPSTNAGVAPVDGTLGVAVNVKGANGTALDTNSGTKSAGTLRVVLATDQPALTNKLLVTPDSVALPANQSVNVNQLAGTTTDTNSGTKSAGTLRVVLATDQPQLTNKLLVTPDANSAVNCAQMNGVNVTMGNGASGTGVQRVTIASDSTGVIAVTDNSGSLTVDNGGTFAVQATIAAGATNVAKAEDVASADADVGVPAMVVRKATPANTSGTDGDYEFMQASGGYLWVHDNKGLSNKAFSAAFTTLTRPANTTAYTAADSISDNATAGSVTALSATVADVNDDPIFLADILISSTDTGLAGKKLRANVFNSNPTSSSGVGAGDNAAYSQKVAGYVGTFVGTLETGFSDGTVGRLCPSFRDTNYTPAGGFVVTKPTSGAATLYIQYVAEEAFTPSANSTTIIGTVRGWQARAV